MGYLLNPRARADLEDIWTYTAQHWGVAQADKYAEGLIKTFERLAERPRSGRAYGRRANYRRQNYEAHAVFYRIVGDSVEIMRVLHQARDLPRHLQP